jgi:surface glycoprotein (TIGR04207 family)
MTTTATRTRDRFAQTTGGNGVTRDRVRAVALAEIMVVSTVAVGAGFAGSVAGQQADVIVTGG